MSTCTVCGGAMKPLFSGLYCPNDCDRKPRVTGDYEEVTRFGAVWRTRIVKRGELVPGWATLGWWLASHPRRASAKVQELDHSAGQHWAWELSSKLGTSANFSRTTEGYCVTNICALLVLGPEPAVTL